MEENNMYLDVKNDKEKVAVKENITLLVVTTEEMNISIFIQGFFYLLILWLSYGLIFIEGELWSIIIGITLGMIMLFFIRAFFLKKVEFYEDRIEFEWHLFGKKTIKNVNIKKVNSTGSTYIIERSFAFIVYDSLFSRFMFFINGNLIGNEQALKIKKLLKILKIQGN